MYIGDIHTPICGSENYKCMRQYSNDGKLHNVLLHIPNYTKT